MKSNERTTQKRSASLRTERSQRAKERVSQASERARNPTGMPPVLSRGSMVGARGSRKKVGQTNVRRKYYYSIGATGTEVRLPALPALQFSWRMLSGLMSAGLLALIWAMWSAPIFQVSRVNVTGLVHIPKGDVLSALNLDGETILKASPEDLAQTLQAKFPDIAQASVQVGLPASVAVSIQERTPIIAWQDDKEIRWIDASGIAYPPRGQEAGLILVNAKGNPPSDTPAAQDSAGAADPGTSASTAAAADLPQDPQKAAAAPFLSTDLIAAIQRLEKGIPAGASIMYDPRYGLGWTDPSGWVVYFGSNIDEMDLKLNQYQVITGELSKQNIHPAMISVEFPDAPFYRLEP